LPSRNTKNQQSLTKPRGKKGERRKGKGKGKGGKEGTFLLWAFPPSLLYLGGEKGKKEERKKKKEGKEERLLGFLHALLKLSNSVSFPKEGKKKKKGGKKKKGEFLFFLSLAVVAEKKGKKERSLSDFITARGGGGGEGEGRKGNLFLKILFPQIPEFLL